MANDVECDVAPVVSDVVDGMAPVVSDVECASAQVVGGVGDVDAPREIDVEAATVPDSFRHLFSVRPGKEWKRP